MFRDIINTPIDPIPMEYTNTLVRLTCEPDYSLTCLGVALLRSRIEDYNGISGCYSSYTEFKTCVDHFCERFKAIDTYPLFCYYKYEDGDFDRALADARLSEFKLKENVTAFVKDKMGHDCHVYYHETKNAVAIFVNTNDFRLYHLLLSFISLYYPSLFKDKPMSKEEFDIVKSINSRTSEEFFKAIRVVIEPYTAEFRRCKLGGMMKLIHQSKVDGAKQQVEDQKNYVKQAEEAYASAISTLRDYIVRYEGLLVTEDYDNPEDDLVDYLCEMRNIHNIRMEYDSLVFSVSTYLTNFNTDAWDIFSDRGYIYDGRYGRAILPEVFQNEANRKLILDNIFSEDAKLLVKMVGNYKLDLRNCRVSTNSQYSYVSDGSFLDSYVPNPHLKLHTCLGGYTPEVMNALKDRNYILAFELCVASVGSVNLDETDLTFRPFIGMILSSNKKILSTKDGLEMTPEEALAWLKGETHEAD